MAGELAGAGIDEPCHGRFGEPTPGLRARASSGTPNARDAGVRTRWGVRIPMRDGVMLSATLYLPAGDERKPALFTMTPYTAQSLHGDALRFAEGGFPFVAVDVRGRGNSEGEFIPFINEARDGNDVAAWLSRQPFCDGRVAMAGGSYTGFTQWETARTHPKALATIVPVASPCVGVDIPFRSNVRSTYLMQWLTLVWGRTLQGEVFWGKKDYWSALFRRWYDSGAPFKDLGYEIGHDSPHFKAWIEHPCPDAHWDSLSPSEEEYRRITIPVLTITGMYDGDQPGALAHYRRHMKATSAEHYLVIGPWDHAGTRMPQRDFCGVKAGPASLIDMHELHLQWYRWTMLGGAKPAFLADRVAYYVLGADRWRYAPSLDAVTLSTEELHLSSHGTAGDVFQSGSLCEAGQVVAGADSYIYDPLDISHTALEATIDPESRADDRLVHARRGKQLVYHSAPLERSREIAGFFALSLWLAIDQPDTDFQAVISAIAPDGRAVELTRDFLRARYRTDERTETLIDTTEPLLYRFTHFPFVAVRLDAGHRLRLVVGPIASIYHEKNYNSGGVIAAESAHAARTVTVRLYHDAERQSRLHIPVGAGDADARDPQPED